jgi:hypothetical protein
MTRRGGHVGDGAQILSNLGVNDVGALLGIGRSAGMTDGTTLSGDNLKLGPGTSVWDAMANDLQLGRGAGVRNQTGIPILPLSNDFCPMTDIACGGDDIFVDRDESANPLSPGSYGNVRLMNGGAVTLLAGTYNFCSIKTGRNASIVVTGDTTSIINVRGNVVLGGNVLLVPDGRTPIPQLNVGGISLRVGPASLLSATITAHDSLLRMGRGVEIQGSFCVNMVASDNGIRLVCPEP